MPGSPTGAHAVCPNRVPVVIGHTFTCQVSGAGSTTKALITIVDDDDGFACPSPKPGVALRTPAGA
jgi:hypothetical protein